MFLLFVSVLPQPLKKNLKAFKTILKNCIKGSVRTRHIILKLWLTLGALYESCPSLTKQFGSFTYGSFFTQVFTQQIVVTVGAYSY